MISVGWEKRKSGKKSERMIDASANVELSLPMVNPLCSINMPEGRYNPY
jgi:hypothetical protein